MMSIRVVLRKLSWAALLQYCLIIHRSGDSFSPFTMKRSAQRLSLFSISDRSMQMTVEAATEGIDVSLIPQLTGAAASMNGFSIPNSDTLQDIQNVAFLAAAVGFVFYERRPRGGARDDLLSVRPSKIVRKNLGVFAKSFIPKGTLIGVYPGFVRTMEDALYLKSSDKAREAAQKYFWSFSDGRVIDPTDRNGQVQLEITYMLGFIKISTTMCRLNEPAKGMDVNAYTKVNGVNVEIYAERNIFEEEELFIDYGLKFDRSDYEEKQIDSNSNISPEEAEKRRRARVEAARRLEEEELLTLQPISDDRAAEGGRSVKYDTSTTNPDGYLSKLSRREDAYVDSGIISPEEGSQLFVQQGPDGAFGRTEDRDLIDSLIGKSSSTAAASKRSSDTSESDDADLYASFLKQIGQDNLDASPLQETVADVSAVTTGGSASSGSSSGGKKLSENSLFEDVMGTSFRQRQQPQQQLKNSDSAVDADDSGVSMFAKIDTDEEISSASMLDSGKFGFSASGSSGSDSDNAVTGSSIDAVTAETTRTAITPEEAKQLSSRLDALSDEQVEEVFRKMRGSLGKIMQQQIDMKKSVQGKVALPKTPPIDPTVREQYNEQLAVVEKELEKMYDDPLKVWQDLMANPDKYLEDDAVSNDDPKSQDAKDSSNE